MFFYVLPRKISNKKPYIVTFVYIFLVTIDLSIPKNDSFG